MIVTNRRRGIYLLPNLFTTAALFSGFYSIVAAMNDQFELAAIAIFVAMVLDGMDGRIARLTNTQSDFGVQYDSLYDMDHHHYGLRTPLSIALSKDRGESWTKVADLAHRDKFSFTNLGCDFVTDDQVVVTYAAYGPERVTERSRYDWHNPDVFDLHAVVVDRDWIYQTR